MAIIQEQSNGPCKSYIHDDSCERTREGSQRIIDNVSRIVYAALSEKAKKDKASA